MVAAAQKNDGLSEKLDPYGQLIRMLMPRAKSIAVYDTDGAPLWLAGGQDDPDLQRLASVQLKRATGRPLDIDGCVRAFDGTQAYAFVLRDDQGLPLAAVTLLLEGSGEQRPFSLTLGLVRPALECLQRELVLRSSLGALTRDLSTRDNDLDLLLDASVENDGVPRDGDELGRLVQAAVDHLDCAFATLIIPERTVSLVRSRGRRGEGRADEVVARTNRHLMAFAQLQRRTMIVNKVTAGAHKLPPYKLLSVPVRHVSSRVIGFLALFNEAGGEDFELRHTRLAELLARKVTSILLASFDAATGLLSRGALEQQVAALLAGRTVPNEYAVIYIDIDQMHVINENFGMHVGDDTIARVAEVVRRRVPAGALCARTSGDRFAVFIADADMQVAQKVADEIRSGAADLTQERPEGVLRVTVSAGVAELQLISKQPLAHALATAEIASKAAKDRGRDRVESFQDTDLSMIRRHENVHMIGTLREALDNHRFRLYAQPILPLATGPGQPRFEILIRLLTEEGEIVPPGKFLPAAEHYQLMPAIDRWVVERTLQTLDLHRDTLRQHVARFAINLSGQSVTDAGAADFIAAQIAATGIPADILCFELTETAAVANLAKADAFMQRLRRLGCQLALDDFGTGASSLAYLKNLPVSVIKIDGSFVRDVLTNPRSESMVKAVAQLARAMGITTVAEYVESDDLRVRMANLGVDYGQGFAIGKPLPLEDVLEDLVLYQMMASGGAAPADDATRLAG